MRTPLRRRLTATVLTGALFAGTLAAAPIAQAAVPVDEAGLANALFGATMRITNRDDDLAKNLVVSAELLDWRAKNPAAAPAAVTTHLDAVRKHVETAVPNQAWSREPVETVSAALAAVRSASGATVDGARLGKLNTTLLGLDNVPVSTKPEDRVSGAQQQFAWESGYAGNQREVWTGVAQTSRADAGFRGAWNAGIGDQFKVNSGGGSAEFAQGEQLRTVLDVGKLQAAAKLGQVQLREATDNSFKDIAAKLYAERKERLDHMSSVLQQNPPDAKPTEPSEAQKTAAKADEEKRKGYIDTAKGGLDGLAFIAGLIDPDFGKRITKFAEGAVKVAYAVNKAVTAFTLINSAFSLATAAFTGNVIGAISSLIGVFGVGGPTIEQQIMEQIKAMREQLEKLQQNMNDRFDKVDAKLDNIYNRMIDEFRKLEKGVDWVRQNTVQLLEKLTSFSVELQVVGTTLLKAIAGLYKLDRWGKIDLYVDYKRKQGQDLPQAGFIQGESDFWVTAVQAPTNELFVVPQANYRTDVPTVLTNLNLHGDGGTAAFLAYYAKASLDGEFTAAGQGGNPAVWGIGANAYGLLVKQNPNWAKQMPANAERGARVLKEGRDIRDQLLSFSQPGPNGTVNKTFQTLLERYAAKADELKDQMAGQQGHVSEGKRLSLFSGPEQGAPAGTPSLEAPAQIEGCQRINDPAWHFSLSKTKTTSGQQLNPQIQFYRYFRGADMVYQPCWTSHVLSRGRDHDLHVKLTDRFFRRDGSYVEGLTHTAVVHTWLNQDAPWPQDAVTYLKNNWNHTLKTVFERDARPVGDDARTSATIIATREGNELLKAKRAEFYRLAGEFVKTSDVAKELNLAARLLRAYTEAGFPRAVNNTDEYLRSALYGPRQLYGAGEVDNEYLLREYQLAAANVATGKPAWDPARADAPSLCAQVAGITGTDPHASCLRQNMKFRQDRLAGRLTEQFKQRWEGADQTLPGLQTQLRTLWLTLRSVHPAYDFGPAIEAPAPIAPAPAIWNEPEAVHNQAAFESGVTTTMFKGRQFVTWRGTDGNLHGSLADSRGVPAPVKIADLDTKKTPFAPTAAEFNGKLVVVWKDFTPGAQYPMQRTAVSTDGRSWTVTEMPAHRRQLHNLDSPTLTVFNGKLLGLYRGVDQLLYLTTSTDGSTWGPAVPTLAGNMTNQRPGMTVHNGKLVVGWRGHDSHSRAYMASSVDGVTWDAPVRVGGTDAGIDGGPALASHGGRLYAVWRGVGADQALYGSFSANGTEWAPQYFSARGVRTNHAPSVVAFGGRLRLAWGPPNDLLQGNTVATASSAVLPG
ncbi:MULTISPECIES: hypothetical protein [unclassified Crossiella]|uniref:hypothetical protein n=1 Tax=unclassified Crossiella TaxID=2620835 RepID=UPI001FFE352B|nr:MULTISPECIES: hypothetical protein [unclassified Crossiella]MCK2241417.1 hypothetical protein [Crossiella sp. S99.2]MCK2257035.1 hypothetical protein [Crossiella sp. S99.1]